MMKKRLFCVFLVFVMACSLLSTAAFACDFPVRDKCSAELVTIPVEKVWKHGDNEAKPEQSTIQLKNGDCVVDEVVLTAENADKDDENIWKGAFKPVPVCGNYTVTETPVEGYETSVVQPEVSATQITALEKNIVSCFEKKACFDGNLLVSYQGGYYYVWTAFELNAEEQKTLIKLINDANLECLGMGLSCFNTIFNFGEDATYYVPVYDPCGFMKYELVTVSEGTVKFCQNKMWSMFYAGELELAHATGAIVTNTYESKTPVDPPEDDDPEGIDVTVEVIWKNDTEANRPGSVVVQLYKNGEPDGDPVTVDASSNWSHKWENLDGNYTWSVDAAQTPTGYGKSVSNEGNAWTITYTLTPDPVNPHEDDDTDDDEPSSPGSGGNGSKVVEPEVIEPEVVEPEAVEPEVIAPAPSRPSDDVPVTGDDTNIGLWISLTFASAIGLLAIELAKKRSSHR